MGLAPSRIQASSETVSEEVSKAVATGTGGRAIPSETVSDMERAVAAAGTGGGEAPASSDGATGPEGAASEPEAQRDVDCVGPKVMVSLTSRLHGSGTGWIFVLPVR